MLRIIILVMILPATLMAQLIYQYELPFGAYSTHGADSSYYSESLLGFMHDSLGFNQMMGSGFDSLATARFFVKSIFPYVWGGTGDTLGDPQMKYAECQYFRSDPESSAYYNAKFRQISGFNYASGYVYGTNGSLLDNLAFGQPHRYYSIGEQGGEKVKYQPSFRMKVSSMGNPASPVAVYKAYRLWPSEGIVFLDTIKFADIIDTSWKELHLINKINLFDYYYALGAQDTTHGDGWINHSLQVLCPCTLSVDYFKVHCQYGAKLIDSASYNSQIIASVARTAYRNKILGWFLKDTERVGNFRPQAYIDSLVRSTSTWDTSIYAASWVTPEGILNSWGQTYRDFVRIVKPKMLWTYLYPIWWNTKYTGYQHAEFPDTMIWKSDSLQTCLKTYVTDPMDSLRAALSILGPDAKWTYTAQYWYKNHSWCSEARRMPTKSEIRCITYLGMCYHADAILPWLFDWGIDEAGCYYEGMLTHNGTLSPIGEVVRDDINPFIKAIDSIYMGLTWDTAYAYNPAYGFHASGNSLIHGITAVNTILASNNPDLGWFQVGEYHDSSDQRYFMLVNRACSQSPDRGTEAPAVAATVWLKPILSERAYYVIDLGQKLQRGSNGDWVGIPETTWINYTADYYQFTTVLKAGEGRLYKVIAAHRNDSNK